MRQKLFVIVMSILLLGAIGGCRFDDGEETPLAAVSSEMDALGVEKMSMDLTNDIHYQFVLETLEKAAEENPGALKVIEDLNTARELALKGELRQCFQVGITG
jgi:hypothetical protein